MRQFTNIRSAAVALVACTLLAGCGGDGPAAGASPSAEPEPTATATPARSTAPGPTAAPPGTVDPDRPGDPVRGFRVLTGTVEASDGCRVIRSGGERWALLGVLAGTLRVGEAYEVRGRPVAVPRTCRTDRAIDVTQARPS